MTPSEDSPVVAELRRRARAGESVVTIVSWLRDQLGPGASGFQLVAFLFVAFSNGLRLLRDVERWQGWSGGDLTDDELEELLWPFVPRTTPVPGAD